MSYNEIQHNCLKMWIDAIIRTEEPCIDTNLKEITNKFLGDMTDYKHTLMAIEKVMQRQKTEEQSSTYIYSQTYLCEKCGKEFRSEYFPETCNSCGTQFNF